jgi:hypothetical protein
LGRASVTLALQSGRDHARLIGPVYMQYLYIHY